MLAVITSPRLTGAPWFALRCVGSPATRAVPCLKQLGVETFFPVVRELNRIPRKMLSHHQRASGVAIMRMCVRPFLTGIVFVRFPSSFCRFEELFDLPSILGFLSIGERPASIASEIVEALRSREVDGVIAGRTPAAMIFKIGDQVRVTHGALSMLQGIIERVPDVTIQDIDADTRLKLTIEIFGRATSVDLAAWQVEKT